MQNVAVRASKLVNTQMSILIRGETGTGKEHLARAIHTASSRAAKPFVAVNCAALPEALIESELFGHEPGAFTGASAKGKKGLILEAHGGTLFLDEIGDMPLTSQTRLLRVLAEREVTPVGRTSPVPVNIRVLAATHRDLIALVKANRFRDDLYFRLNAAILSLPPLRDRNDLDWLIHRLLSDRPDQEGRRHALTAAAHAALHSYGWPGNVRELVNCLDFACAVSISGVIDIGDLPDTVGGMSSPSELPSSIAASETAPFSDPLNPGAALLDQLKVEHWNISAVARNLGVDRSTVHRQMKRYGILPPRWQI
jgi:transcriptional regulator of acetoin/glycerol metabolism